VNPKDHLNNDDEPETQNTQSQTLQAFSQYHSNRHLMENNPTPGGFPEEDDHDSTVIVNQPQMAETSGAHARLRRPQALANAPATTSRAPAAVPQSKPKDPLRRLTLQERRSLGSAAYPDLPQQMAEETYDRRASVFKVDDDYSFSILPPPDDSTDHALLITRTNDDGKIDTVARIQDADDLARAVHEKPEFWHSFLIGFGQVFQEWEQYVKELEEGIKVFQASEAPVADEALQQELNDRLHEISRLKKLVANSAGADRIKDLEARLAEAKAKRDQFDKEADDEYNKWRTAKDELDAAKAETERLRTMYDTAAADNAALRNENWELKARVKTPSVLMRDGSIRGGDTPRSNANGAHGVHFDVNGRPETRRPPANDEHNGGSSPYHFTTTSSQAFQRQGTPLSTSSNSGTYKAPDIKTYSAKEDENYEQWRMQARDKLRTLPAEHQVGYLRRYLAGDAWNIVRRLDSQDPEEFFQRLNSVYDSTDKDAEAEMKLWDGSLRMKTNESVNEWYARFLGDVDRLDMRDRQLISHAYRLMLPRFANSLSSAASTNETFTQLISRARALELRQADITIGRQ